MPLKVLLADDSAAIKKVVQLSLQDLGVELKAISSGKDAIEVAKQFKPHIAFVDVLLPQKSGYDVATEIKKDSDLTQIPVILLWSAFMAFDEGKYKTCGADAKLEKPFDSNALRELVTKFVPSVKASAPSVEFEMPIGSVPPAKKSGRGEMSPEVKTESKPLEAIPTQGIPTKPESSRTDWSMSSFEDIPPASAEPVKVAQVAPIPNFPPPLKPPSATTTPDPSGWNSGDSEWVRKDLGKFQVPIPHDSNDEGLGEAVPFTYTESKIVDTSFLFKPHDAGTSTMLKNQNSLSHTQGGQTPSSAVQSNPFAGSPFESSAFEAPLAQAVHNSVAQELKSQLPQNLTLEELSDLKLQTREIIEKVVWKLVPEIASQMIREELDRLLAEK